MQKHTQYLLVGLLIGIVGLWVVQNLFTRNYFGMMGGYNFSQQSSMHGAMQGMMQGLDNKQGADFDQAFLAGMIVHHQGAVEMAKAAQRYSQKTEIKNLANDIIFAQEKEIQQMQSWQKQWYK